MVDRRMFMIAMFLGLLAPGAADALAKDGDSDGGGDGDGGGDSSGSGSDGGGSDDSGSDDSGGDDSGSDDSGGDKSGKGKGNSGKGRGRNDDDPDDDDDDRIRSAVRDGRAEPLRNILAAVRKRYDGQIVGIRLTGKRDSLLYRIRIIDPGNKLIEVRVNARTARILGAAGN